MTPSSRAAAGAVGASALALSAYVSPVLAQVVVALGSLVFAWGWPRLVELPTVRGPAVVIALTALAAVLLVPPGGVEAAAVVMGLAVVVAFVHQMLRRDGRPRLVESISGVVTGAVVVVAASLWVAVDDGPDATPLVVAGAAALAVAAACTVVPLGAAAVATLATVAAAGGGLLVGHLLPGVGLLPGAVVGAGSGIITAALHVLFGRFPHSTRPVAALAAAMSPLLVGAVPVYLAAQLLAR